MLTKIFIAPPLGFARAGTSPHPCVAFHWGPNDLSPRGTGTTSLVPAETLEIATDGTISSHVPKEILFRDRHGIRPVCPFFELHAEWTDAEGSSHSGPVALALLSAWGAQLSDVRWQVEVENRKPYHYTYVAGDRIVGRGEVAASQHALTPVLGSSPADAAQPLVRANHPVPMGSIQAAKPTEQFPELRLRFNAPRGLVYGPTDLPARMVSLDFDLDVAGEQPNAEWRGFTLPGSHLTLNRGSELVALYSGASHAGSAPRRRLPQHARRTSGHRLHAYPLASGHAHSRVLAWTRRRRRRRRHHVSRNGGRRRVHSCRADRRGAARLCAGEPTAGFARGQSRGPRRSSHRARHRDLEQGAAG